MISVICPTVSGREDHFERCKAAYERTLGNDLQWISLKDYPTCGDAWNAGAEKADGEYIHFTADDLEPHDGWLEPAVEAVKRNYLPAPRIVNPAGGLDYCGYHGVEMPDKAIVEMSVIPFMSREQWDQIGPCLEIHYFSDNYLSWRGARAGYKTVVRRAYAFTHYWAEPGRGAGMTYGQRMDHDRKLFVQATKVWA